MASCTARFSEHLWSGRDGTAKVGNRTWIFVVLDTQAELSCVWDSMPCSLQTIFIIEWANVQSSILPAPSYKVANTSRNFSRKVNGIFSSNGCNAGRCGRDRRELSLLPVVLLAIDCW
jgi:hypothetical protein